MSFLPRNGEGENGERAGAQARGERAGADARDEGNPPADRTGRDARRHPGPPEGRPESRSLHRQEERSRLRRAFGLTALGTLIPGAGLTFTRRRVLGLLLVGLTVAALVALAVYVQQRGLLDSALDLAARPRLLGWMALGIVAAALVWCVSIVGTAMVSRPTRMSGRQRTALSLFTGVMCLVVAAPAAIGLRYIDVHRTAVDAIFAGGGPGSGDDRTAAPDPDNANPWENVPRVNVLLLGSDSGDNRVGIRTDSMIVASVDTVTGDTVLFGIPRNLENVPIPPSNPLHQVWPRGYNCGDECLMNGIWTEAERQAELRPELFAGDPDPGLTATEDVLSEVLGIGIDNTAIVDLDGFSALVDAMGGVDVTVQERIPIGGKTATDANGNTYIVPGSINGWIEAGPQHLNGYEALWFSRSRATTDDFSRMRRQRCMVGALLNQVNAGNMLQRYPALAAAAGDNIQTDVAQDELPAWVELVQQIQDGTIESLPFTLDNTNVVNPDFESIRQRVQDAIEPEPETPTDAPSATEPGRAPTDPTSPPTTPATTTTTTTGPGVGEPTPTESTDELSVLETVC